MRTYLSSGYRRLSSGSIEVEGRWAGVQWIALAMVPLLLLGWRSPQLLAAIGIAAAALYVFPARRRVVFDLQRESLRIEHAGFFAEPGARTIPFAELRGFVFHKARRRGGRADHAVFARTAEGPLYLLNVAGAREAEDLAERLRALVE